MEDMIINPIWIYAIEIISNVSFALKLAVGVCAIATVFVSIYRYDCVDADIAWADKILKRLIVAIFTMFVICIFIPSKQTMYAMFITSYLTKQNVERVKGDITKSIDYIFEKIKAEKKV